MVTGDNVVTARAIAKECGIITSESDVVIEGPVFRTMSPAQVDAILPRLKVMARSSPKDKNWLVRRLVRTRSVVHGECSEAPSP
jgi:Ca2+-transporting ATPase